MSTLFPQLFSVCPLLTVVLRMPKYNNKKFNHAVVAPSGYIVGMPNWTAIWPFSAPHFPPSTAGPIAATYLCSHLPAGLMNKSVCEAPGTS